jgi:ATP-dependent DNA helicase DinG
MGAVLSFSGGGSPRPVREPDWAESAYQSLAENVRDFRIKPEQVDLSRAICRAMVSDIPLAAEAPTGIGKTLAYLIGALAAQRELAARGQDMPIVVATGTIALQSQIMDNDLPKLVAAGLLRADDARLLKGRARYFCPLAAERLVGDRDVDLQYGLFEKEAPELEFTRADAIPLLDDFLSGEWGGSFDGYALPVRREVRSATSATADTCLGQGCAHLETCPYKLSRKQASTALLVVANHDLLLLDLEGHRKARQNDDSGSEVLPCQDYLLVIDEAHHLPEKALETQKSIVDFQEIQALLAKVAGWAEAAFSIQEVSNRLLDVGVNPDMLSTADVARDVDALTIYTQTLVPDESGARLFNGGDLPSELVSKSMNLAMSAVTLGTLMERAGKALKSSKLADRMPRLAAIVHGLVASGLGLGSELSNVGESAQSAVNVRVEHGYWSKPGRTVESSPLHPGPGLSGLLWESSRCRPALVSATLKDFRDLSHFRVETGFPEQGLELVLPHVFDYSKSVLQIAKLHTAPTYADMQEWTQELKFALADYVDPDEGTLLLFQSRATLEAVRPILEKARPGGLWQTGGASVQRLKEQHQARILEGRGSYLVGLASMAEGLDLPGKLCSHVIIVKLPFTVPSDPLSVLRKRNDPKYWEHQVMPATLRKLLQQVGRLLRRDTDVGRVTILDNRLLTEGYGRRLCLALPPFSKKLLHPTRPKAIPVEVPSAAA